jgi:hypothetical protein
VTDQLRMTTPTSVQSTRCGHERGS